MYMYTNGNDSFLGNLINDVGIKSLFPHLVGSTPVPYFSLIFITDTTCNSSIKTAYIALIVIKIRWFDTPLHDEFFSDYWMLRDKSQDPNKQLSLPH